jgi:hypothetical protein
MTWAALLVLLFASAVFFVASLVFHERGRVHGPRNLAARPRDAGEGRRTPRRRRPPGSGRGSPANPAPED